MVEAIPAIGSVPSDAAGRRLSPGSHPHDAQVRALVSQRNALAATTDDAAPMRLLFALFMLFVIVRIALNALILNQVVNYTSPEGSTIEKIHPAFYGIAIVAAAVLATRRIALDRRDAAVLRAIVVFMAGVVLLCAMLAVGGHSTATGYILDAYGVACLAAFVMLAAPDPWRTQLGRLVLGFLLASAAVGIAEFVLHKRLLPYPGGEDVFRPTGLSDHPLAFGQWCAVGIGMVGVARWKPPLRYAAVAVLFVGAMTSGARAASVAAGLIGLAFLVLEPMAGRSRVDVLRRKLVLVIGGTLALGGTVAVMAAFGALSRFKGGLVDTSSLARVSVYGVFDYLSWNEFLFGADLGHVQRIALDVFGLPFIESSFVVFTVQFGLIGAVLFGLILANLFRALLLGRSTMTKVATLGFLALSLSNNALSAKSADMLTIALLILCDVARPAGRAAP